MDIKNEVLYRVYGLLFGIFVPISIVLLYKTIYISAWEGQRWRDEGASAYIKPHKVEAERGNIMADDGSLLATSIPYYNLYFDAVAASDYDFNENLDTLAQCLATHVLTDKTVGGIRQDLMNWRDSTKRYVKLKMRASYAEKEFIQSFPLFRKGQFRSGLIVQRNSERKRPFGIAARRTIGYVRDGAVPVGLEGYFNETLGGTTGTQMMLALDKANDIWIPLDDLTKVEPKSGDDIVTTLDINLQDIVENELYKAVNYHDAEWGTAVLMEVKTGKVRALANLGRIEYNEETKWYEDYNYAVGRGIEPGSTFKLATIMALLEDGYIDLNDSIDIERGQTTFYEEKMEDSSPFSFKIDSTSIKRAFEISSNVGMAKLVTQYYAEKNAANDNIGAAKFIKRLKEFNLHIPTGVEIGGEANPYIKEAYSEEDQWSGTTLPWMSIGYELKLSPLQLLTFFNAVANDGVMVKPHLVTEVQRYGETVDLFRPTILNKRIASTGTIEKAQELLEAVVTNGTAYKLKSKRFNFAGKTGTAQVNYRRSSRGTRVGGYQASFAGYFPAEDPVYSCIVVINKPKQNGIYGSEVAGPVFKRIAEKCYTSKLEMHRPINDRPLKILASNELPIKSIGEKTDMKYILDYLDVEYFGNPGTDLTVLDLEGDSLMMNQRSIPADRMPSVVGLGLRDALFVLENKGLKVEVDGYGKVARQSLRAGTVIQGQTVKLTMQ
ncbi:MAG: transpeptidase family protein [Saprospiraceae bacterium]|nr:transpeptidase family protein [Saprospiraceae bacterium]